MPISSQDIVVLPGGRMDTKNAAAYCGLSVKTLAMMRCKATGPRFIKPGRIFYLQKDLDEWLHRNAAWSTAQARTGKHAD
ncbi:MAG: helix-turn-helix domain-containing protein [Betaproteobacteria bacterium]|nr:helix-turn-helix domain-containing protein [Betaproteobacteria bacterium]